MTFDWNFSKRIEAINLEQAQFKYIILGNSLAMDGIDCKELGDNKNGVYNLAIGGASLKTSHIQLQEYLEIALKNPEKIILPIGSYRQDYFENNLIHPIVEFTMSDYDYNIHDLPMLKFKWIFFELLKKIVSPDHRNSKLVQGQLRISKIVPDKTILDNTKNKLPLSKYQNSEEIKQIYMTCLQNDIELVLMEMIGFRNTRNHQDIGPYEIQYDQSHSVKLYNFNGFQIDSIIDPKSDWLGGSHLNQFGASKFTNHIKQYILE